MTAQAWWRFAGNTRPKLEALGLVTAGEAQRWWMEGDTLLVDIREPEEHARRSIPFAFSAPLSRFPAALETGSRIKRVVFHCESGNRTRLAAARLAASTTLPSFQLAGGFRAWLQTERV